MTTVTVLSGPERRRRWTSAEKLRIVEESLGPGASVVEVARRHDVHRNLVTAWRRQARTDVLACGPEPMLEAVRAVASGAQLAWEAPMACGYGACYGCAVEIDGRLKRLCVEGPVLCAA